jgi:hypothetical protein
MFHQQDVFSRHVPVLVKVHCNAMILCDHSITIDEVTKLQMHKEGHAPNVGICCVVCIVWKCSCFFSCFSHCPLTCHVLLSISIQVTCFLPWCAPFVDLECRRFLIFDLFLGVFGVLFNGK